MFTKAMAALAALLVVAVIGVTGISAEPDAAENPLSELAFLAGTWRGEMSGGVVEEIWSEPAGGAMMGMFRWLSPEGRARMYEMLTISREEDGVRLRLRHFTSAMIAWEEKDSPVVLKLASSQPGRAVFTNESDGGSPLRITFHQPGEGELAIDVEFHEESARPPLAFRLRRHGSTEEPRVR
jgi:hypothetical protein